MWYRWSISVPPSPLPMGLDHLNGMAERMLVIISNWKCGSTTDVPSKVQNARNEMKIVLNYNNKNLHSFYGQIRIMPCTKNPNLFILNNIAIIIITTLNYSHMILAGGLRLLTPVQRVCIFTLIWSTSHVTTLVNIFLIIFLIIFLFIFFFFECWQREYRLHFTLHISNLDMINK